LSTPPERRPTEVAGESLRRARSNLALAKAPKDLEVVWDDLCFQAQQAAEKAVKAVLVVRRLDFPRTHRIAELLELYEREGDRAPDDVWAAEELSDYAVVGRYPDNPKPADESGYRRAVMLAETVVRWAEQTIRG
jgi:HEPN domain-containing protein